MTLNAPLWRRPEKSRGGRECGAAKEKTSQRRSSYSESGGWAEGTEGESSADAQLPWIIQRQAGAPEAGWSLGETRARKKASGVRQGLEGERFIGRERIC